MPPRGKPPSAPRARGRPRSELAKHAILDAARTLLARGGPGAVTMEAVAALAGVGKPTVYRWYPDRHAVAMAALMDSEPAASPDTIPRSALRALREQLRAIARRFATATGRHITSMIAAADTESELSRAFRNHFVLARRAEGQALLEHAIARKELRANLDIEVTLDLLYGPVFFRLLIGHAPLDEAFMDQVLDEVLRGAKR
ncbi:MAG: TetR/AcrR family transcriptional regulator [Kofleriaceae bacterium]